MVERVVPSIRTSSEVFWILYSSTGRLTGDEPGFLSQEERDRLAGLRFEKRRTEWLLGRKAAKLLLDACGVKKPRIANQANGAPYALDEDGNRVSGHLTISHRNDMALIAYSRDVLLGADLEWVEEKSDEFIEDYFTVDERDWILSVSSERRGMAACLGWSAKEAGLKAMETGLRVDTRSLCVDRIEGWDDHSLSEGCWHTFRIRGAGLETANGWWMMKGEYILTMVILDKSQVVLREIKNG